MNDFSIGSRLGLWVVLWMGVVVLPLHAAGEWVLPSHPYRLRLDLEQEVRGRSMLTVETAQIIELLRAVAVDPLDQGNLAFESAVLVNPATGQRVGRFELMPDGEPFAIDGNFEKLRRGEASWLGFNPAKMSFKSVRLGGKPHHVLMVREDRVANVRMVQEVPMLPGQRYLLDYWLMCDPTDNEMDVMVHHPHLRLFGHVQHSYSPLLGVPGEWARHQVMFLPELSDSVPGDPSTPLTVELRITHAFVGVGGVASLSLRPVSWRLVVEADAPLKAVDLYVQARAGHHLTVPQDSMITRQLLRQNTAAKPGAAERHNLNPDAVRVESQSLSLWTLDPTLPLKVAALSSYAPAMPSDLGAAAELTVLRGDAASLVMALDASQPRIDELEVTHDLGLAVEFTRLARIPVYDGPTVRGQVMGKLLETRYDPMVPLDYAHDADSDDGQHVLVATVRADAQATPGDHTGTITLKLGERVLSLPVKVRVPAMTVKPMRHFATMFGAQAYLVARPGGTADMAEDAVSIASYHGLSPADQAARPVATLPADSFNLRKLVEKYSHTLLDNHLSPGSPMLFVDFSYTVTERGPGLAPQLSDWDFSQGFDQAIQDFVIGRDIPRVSVYHTNGHLMHMLRLRNGVTYSVEPNPADPNWVHLPRKEFDQLVGDYFEGMAQYLDTRGILDRAMLVIDETGTETYDNVHAFVKAFKSRPLASRIMVGHTILKTGVWTKRLPDGSLLMDEVLDVPMPANDETYNYFDARLNAQFKKPKTQWVYNVETDHMDLHNAGLSTALLPLKLENLGVEGWYCWESFMWSLPYAYLPGERGSMVYGTGPVINPWVNPFYHHGPGVLSFFYPPDARGPAAEPTHLVIPSYRLSLMRDGITLRALLEVLRQGVDDAGRPLPAVDKTQLAEAESLLDGLWPDNPVQWYLDYHAYQRARALLQELAGAGSEP